MTFPLCKLAVREVAETFGEADKIGKGAQGNVYLIQWQGKPAALKVCNTASAIKEINNTKLIMSLKSKAPPEIGAYLPEIYKANMVEQGDTTYGIIIMEPLEKLPGKTKADLFSRLYEKSAKEQQRFLKDPGFISHKIHAIVDQDFKSLSDEGKESLTSAGVNAFLEYVSELDGSPDSRILTKLTESIKRSLRTSGLSLSDLDIKALVNNAITDIAEASYVPVFRDAPTLPGPEGESLRAALDWLVLNGITWDDLHDGNLLSRANGHLVLIDFGTYAAEAEAGPDLPKYAFSLFLS